MKNKNEQNHLRMESTINQIPRNDNVDISQDIKILKGIPSILNIEKYSPINITSRTSDFKNSDFQ
jgi:hypothetical protein